jgi:hypothetical protein
MSSFLSNGSAATTVWSSRKGGRLRRLLLVVLSLLSTVVTADFGDYADPSFDCPARTTCPVVCVATPDDCPDELACNTDEPELCADGACAPSGQCRNDVSQTNHPCASCPSLPVACAKVVQTYDSCLTDYAPYYEAARTCADDAADGFNASDDERGFRPAARFALVWATLVTAATLAWCAWNQRVGAAPAARIVVGHGNEDDIMTVVAYRHCAVGRLLFHATRATLALWVVVLTYFTVEYYRIDTGGAGGGARQPVLAEEERDALRNFIGLWSVGLVWSVGFLQWPTRWESLFWRRTTLAGAPTVVAILHERSSEEDDNRNVKTLEEQQHHHHHPFAFFGGACGWGTWIARIRRLRACANAVMTAALSDVDGLHTRAGANNNVTLAFCPVRQHADGSLFVVFELRRYNLVDDANGAGTLVPATCTPPLVTIGDFLSSQGGLDAVRVRQRLHQVGPNSVDLPKPSFAAALHDEISQPFYTYQLFMIFTWLPLYYYYMAST